MKLLLIICLSAIFYSYILYPILLKIFVRIRPQGAQDETYLPFVSIIIAAYNEDKVIEKKVQNCLSLDYPKDSLEIIVASDGSTDRTNDIVRQYAQAGIQLIAYPQRRGKVNVLNSTVPGAKGDIIVFTDANAVFQKDAISKLIRPFSNEKIGCVCGLLKFLSAEGSSSGELEGVYWRYETFLKKREGAMGSLLGANGAIYAIRKELFFACPPDTIVEDFVIPMKILEKGFQVVYDHEAIAYEEAAKHIIQEKGRRIRIGAGDYQALFMLWHMLNPLRGFPALAFWSHKVLRWFAPFFMTGAFMANLFLLSQPLFLGLFIIQCLFYLCAFLGQMLSWIGVSVKILNLCYYFVSMNLALFLGFIRFVTRTQSVAWERTER